MSEEPAARLEQLSGGFAVETAAGIDHQKLAAGGVVVPVFFEPVEGSVPAPEDAIQVEKEKHVAAQRFFSHLSPRSVARLFLDSFLVVPGRRQGAVFVAGGKSLRNAPGEAAR